MRIGILTYYNVHNYGAILQMYALSSYLKQKGHQVEILQFDRNYKDNVEQNQKKYNLSIKSIPYYLTNFFRIGPVKIFNNFVKFEKLKNFKKKFITMGKTYSDYSLGELDLVIIGSDEVFATDIGTNPFFYGHGVSAAKIISYAGCFGKTVLQDILDNHLQDLLRSGFQKFSAISARDFNSCSIIRKIAGIEPELVCDPVLLYGFKKERNKNSQTLSSKYMVVYSYDKNLNDSKEIEAIRKYARSKNLKIVSVGYYHKWCDKNVMPKVLDIFAWFQQAECVFTDTFHGAVLSLLLQANFSVLIRDNSNKLQFLMDQYHLSSRCSLDLQKSIALLDQPIDYTNVLPALHQSIHDSRKFLNTQLEN